MNHKYMTVLSRDEFIKLYRFGAININRNFVLKQDNNIENNLIELFKMLSYNESSDYLMITIHEDNFNKNFKEITYPLEVSKIKKIEVLSEKAERFYRTKVNHKVSYYLTPFSNILPSIEKYQELNDMSKGVDILFELFSINNREEIKKELGFDFKENFLEKYEKYDRENINYLENEYQNFYFDLLFYVREIKFTKEDVGFIYDMMILSLLKNRDEKIIKKFRAGSFSLSQSTTYKILESNKQDSIFGYLSFISSLNDKNIQNFLNTVNRKNLIIGTIFFKIKSLLEEKEENLNYWNDIVNLINSCPKEYKKELDIALYLIGLVFGYRGLNEPYYDFLEKKKTQEIDNLEEESKNENFFTRFVMKPLGFEWKENKELLELRKAKTELEKLQQKKDSKIKELEEVKATLKSEKDIETKKFKAELEKLQEEKESKTKELEESKLMAEKERVETEKKAKDELEKLQKEKDSKIEELEKAKLIAEKERVEAEQKAKDEMEKLQKERDNKINELRKIKDTLEREKEVEAKKLEEEQKAKVKLEQPQKEKNILKDNVNKILKNINDLGKLQHIVEELHIKTKATSENGLKNAIKKICETEDKIDKLQKIVISANKEERLF